MKRLTVIFILVLALLATSCNAKPRTALPKTQTAQAVIVTSITPTVSFAITKTITPTVQSRLGGVVTLTKEIAP